MYGNDTIDNFLIECLSAVNVNLATLLESQIRVDVASNPNFKVGDYSNYYFFHYESRQSYGEGRPPNWLKNNVNDLI